MDHDHERCDACRFDGGALDDEAVLTGLRDLGPRWRALLAGAGDDLRRRPAPEVWSAIEYAAHSRDITALHVFGVEQGLTGEEPVYPDIAADDLIQGASGRYADEDPEAVLDALDAAARGMADAAAKAPPGGWVVFGITIGDDRTTVRRLLEHGLHDSVHHLDDVERGLRQLRA